MKDRTYKLMLRAFDSPLRKQESELLKSGLMASRVLRDDQKFFATLRAVISSSRYPSFEPAFVRRVVDAAFSAYDEFGRWLSISFRRVVIATIVVSVLCVYYNLSRRDSVNVASVFGQPEPSIDQVLQVERLFQ